MRLRQNVIDIFSSFVQFEGDRFSGWLNDPKLRRSMDKCLKDATESDKAVNFWVIYWHKAWQSQSNTSLPKAHLIAYLQESCYWSAHKTNITFTSSRTSVSDCFQLAIAQVDKVLKGFNPERGAILKNYASAIFGSLIRESLRQQGIIDICTPWALLRKISHKALTQALQKAGLSDRAISIYILAWNSYKNAYTPTASTGSRKLDTPSSATWEAIAQAYQSQSHILTDPPKPTVELLEKWLLNCAKAARDYFYPNLASLNAPAGSQETGELLDTLAVTEDTSLLGELIDREEIQNRQTQQEQLREILVASIAKLPSESQQILIMYYAQGLTQQEMAATLQTKQYTVSRRLTKAKEQLLLTLAEWTQNVLHISLTSDVLKNSTALLEEWLTTHYHNSEV
jgi:RNA polymerase sigma factor (sigma-70 family)